jgi:hypothetical protein
MLSDGGQHALVLAPLKSGFSTTERVSLKHAFGPSFSLLLHPGWAGLHLHGPMPCPLPLLLVQYLQLE